MAKGQYEAYTDRASGIRVAFWRDPADPGLLHIYARHLTTPEDAIETFLAAAPAWNGDRRRFETCSETHGLFRYWLEQGAVVMVISCFRMEST